MPKLTKDEKRKRNHRMLQALPALFQGKSQRMVDGILRSLSELVAKFQAHDDALAEIEAITAQLTQAVLREGALDAELKALMPALKNLAIVSVGAESPRLLELGFTPRKRPKMSAEAKARANTKRQQTREQRGLSGKRKRKKSRTRA